MTDQISLQALLDQEEIKRVIYRYCHAVDRRDYAALLDVFHPDGRMLQNGEEFAVADFSKTAFLEIMDNFAVTHHKIGNILTILDGDVAHSEAYLEAHHRVRAGARNPAMLAGHTPGVEEDLIVCGRYLNRMERRDGAWKIAHRTMVYDWQRWDPASDRGFVAQPTVERSFA